MEFRIARGVGHAATFYSKLALDLADLALAYLLTHEGLADTTATTDPYSPLAAKRPQHKATAKNVIFLFMEGGPSHLDLFDPKPKLRRAGWQAFTGKHQQCHHGDGGIAFPAAGRSARLEAARQKRHLGFRLVAAFGRVCRRFGRHPLLLGRWHQSLRRRLPDEFRCRARRPAVVWERGSPTVWEPKMRICRPSS